MKKEDIFERFWDLSARDTYYFANFFNEFLKVEIDWTLVNDICFDLVGSKIIKVKIILPSVVISFLVTISEITWYTELNINQVKYKNIGEIKDLPKIITTFSPITYSNKPKDIKPEKIVVIKSDNVTNNLNLDILNIPGLYFLAWIIGDELVYIEDLPKNIIESCKKIDEEEDKIKNYINENKPKLK